MVPRQDTGGTGDTTEAVAIVDGYHWREVPQISLFVATKSVFCRDKIRLLSRQKYACRNKILSRQYDACRDKTFVVTNISRDKHVCLSGKNKSFVATDTCLLRQNTSSVATKLLSRQTFCRDKRRVLSRQK